MKLKNPAFLILAVFLFISTIFVSAVNAQNCEIINVFWGNESGVGQPKFGDIVKMTATGNGCSDWVVFFEIWENNTADDNNFVKSIFGTFDNNFVKSVSGTFSSSPTSTSSIARAEWKVDDGNKLNETSGTYQFYIKAVTGGSRKESSKLNVPSPVFFSNKPSLRSFLEFLGFLVPSQL